MICLDPSPFFIANLRIAKEKTGMLSLLSRLEHDKVVGVVNEDAGRVIGYFSHFDHPTRIVRSPCTTNDEIKAG